MERGVDHAEVWSLHGVIYPARYTGLIQVLPDAARHAIELRTVGGSTTRLVFTGKPWPAK